MGGVKFGEEGLVALGWVGDLSDTVLLCFLKCYRLRRHNCLS